MRILDFRVRGQNLGKLPGCDFSNIVAGSQGYLLAKFHFVGTEWDECKKVASFTVGELEHPVVLDENDECVIPAEALRGEQMIVKVIGGRVGTEYRIPTGPMTIKLKQEVR